MASPLQTGKQPVNLASSGSARPRGSRIRRDPPPAVKEKVVLDPEERDQWAVVVGVLAFALAIFVLVLAFSSYSAWSPSEYSIEVTADE